ncbi:hypothetical protein QBC37DRAFT_384442 [Rhypophila decipiens]|uniref:Secreted protein n=1 Tax=Rhypophila decipiens TaxID=261697 RepID=A0AAN6YFE5_9PEZI|nr:hypothetical protein QBC37DRAFT_384442 [Rhypophila decipiens]
MLCMVTALVAFLAAPVLGLPVQAPIPGYGVEDIVWGVDVYGNGTIVNITGTVQNVLSHLNEHNPALVKKILASHPNASDHHEEKAQRIRCIDKMDPAQNIFGWDVAGPKWIHDGAKYLQGVGGQPTNGPGPGNCGRVSCEYHSAIWWCNDNNKPITLPSFSTIGYCATNACDLCPDSWSPDRCLGQGFDTDGWNCIVRRDEDSC